MRRISPSWQRRREENMEDRPFTPNDILDFSEGFRLTKGTPSKDDCYDSRITGVHCDSREVLPGSFFFALPGEHTDGHRYISEAFLRGALGAVAQVSNLSRDPSWFLQLPEAWKRRMIFVEDTTAALQASARAYAHQFKDITKIGITGSCGKTTTKELLHAIISKEYPTVKNPGNRNSVVGLPMSLFSIQRHHRYGIFEMGISTPGEMDVLTRVYRPHIGMVTNIGSAHAGTLGSLADTAREKGRIFSLGALRGYMHEDILWGRELSHHAQAAFRFFGLRHTQGIKQISSRGLSGWVITYRGKRISFPLIGYHNLVNACGAITLSEDLGITPSSIAAGLESAAPLAGRGRVIPGSVTVIEDYYNANADSMESMLRYVNSVKWRRGRVVLVLGAMKELGHESPLYHRAVGHMINRAKPSGVFLYGDEMEETRRVLDLPSVIHTDDIEQLRRQVSEFVRPGDLVLIKGSRAMEMERLVPSLCRAV